MDKGKGLGTHLPVCLGGPQEAEPLVHLALHVMTVGHSVDPPGGGPVISGSLVIRHVCISEQRLGNWDLGIGTWEAILIWVTSNPVLIYCEQLWM